LLSNKERRQQCGPAGRAVFQGGSMGGSFIVQFCSVCRFLQMFAAHKHTHMAHTRHRAKTATSATTTTALATGGGKRGCKGGKGAWL